MPTVLIIVGLVVTLVGVGLVVTATFQRPAQPATEAFDLKVVKEIFDAFNTLLDKLEQRYRIGVVVMAVGLLLVGLGAYLEAKDAKDEAKDAAKAALVLRRA